MSTTSDDLLDRVLQRHSSWPQAWSDANGFGLLVANPESRPARMRQARRVLVTQHVLETVATPARPVMLMKGLEVAQLYPSVLQRPFRDVDLLLGAEGRQLWDELTARGYRQHPARRIDLDHHHLPPLAEPSGTVGIEVHSRPNLPRWARIPLSLLMDTAEPSRTGVAHVTRPRDDLHALLLALHGWKGGFTKARDLLDALLLAEVSDVPVEATARELGLARFWTWTRRLADLQLFDRASRSTRIAGTVIVPRRPGRRDRNRTRVLAPYLAASPWRVTGAHIADIRLGREARRSPVTPGE